MTKSASPTETPPEVIDDVRRRRGVRERALEIGGHVAHDAEVEHVAVEPRQHAVQRVAVAVVDLAGRQRRADRHQLVAGREERHAQPAIDRDFADPQRRHRSQLGRAHPLPGTEHHLTGLEVLAGEAPVLARLRDRACGDGHPAGNLARALLHDDGVGAFRHHRAGEDAHRLAGADAARVRLAGERFADPPQRGVGVRGEIGEANRPAVHRRVVVTGNVQRRDDVGGEHAAQRRADRDALDGAHGCEKRADQRARLVDGHRVRIVVVGTGGFAQGLGCGHGGRVGNAGGRRRNGRGGAANAGRGFGCRGISPGAPPRVRRAC